MTRGPLTFPTRLPAFLLPGVLLLASLLVGPARAAEAPAAAGPWSRPDWAEGSGAGAVGRVFDGIRVDGHGPGEARVRAITDNVEAWWTRWWILNRAERSIDITYFIVENDAFGLSLMGLLARKARQGVRIRFMVDSRGSKGFSSVLWGRGYLKELSKLPGVDVRVFNPLHKAILRLPEDLRLAVASNHDKLVIVDDEWVLTGGRNIGAEYFAHPVDDPDVFRDTDVLMQGRAVAEAARKAFDEEFAVLKNDEVQSVTPRWTARSARMELARQIMDRYVYDGTVYSESRIGSKLRPLARELHEALHAMPRLGGYKYFEPFPRVDPVPVMVLDKHSRAQDLRNDISPNLVRLIDAAEQYVLIQNPYVILTRDVGEALKRASKRGVRILVHTNSPKSGDSVFTQAFFLRDWKRMLQDMPTMRIFVFKGEQPVHAKVMIFDDEVTVIGTYNMDPMSRAINSEVVALVRDRDFAIAHRLRVAEDLAVSDEYKIRVRRDGSVETLRGPEDYMRGWSGFVIRVISKLGFLKRMV